MQRAQTIPHQLSKSKKIAFYGLMVIFAFMICFGALEIVLTAFFSGGETPAWGEFHPVLGWTLKPGEYHLKALQRLSRFSIHINEYGLRSHQYPLIPKNRRRLLILGDSFVFAKETRTERIFSYLLQDRFEKEGQRSFEVMNAGIPAYGTAQELLLMRELREKYGITADINLLVFFTNDILDNLCLSYGNLISEPVRPRFIVSEEGALTLSSFPDKNGLSQEDDTLVQSRRMRGSKTIFFAKSLIESWIQTKPSLLRSLGRLGIRANLARVPGLLNGWYRDEITAKGIPLTSALIREIQSECKNRNTLLLIAMVPSPFQVYSETYLPILKESLNNDPIVEAFATDILKPQRILRTICADAGIPFLDLYSASYENRAQRLFIPRDGHLTDAGHKLVARSLYDFVMNQTASH